MKHRKNINIDQKPRDYGSLLCPKCGCKMKQQDFKRYKSYEKNEQIKIQEHNTYIHRWHKCPNCGTSGQSAQKWIEGTIVENNYEDFQLNLEYFKESKTSAIK